jgi:cytochrome c-type biogenesis protein CcmH
MKTRSVVLSFLVVWGLAFIGPAFSVEPDEILQDAVLEARARELSKELRCLVCQNENIDSSHAPLARDLRILLRERLVAGDSDDQVRAFLVERFGDFVLLKPPVQGNTLALWLTPALFMVLALLGVLGFTRGARTASRDQDLSDAEARRLVDLLDDD